MQTITMYAVADSTLGTVRDYANARGMTPPIFTRGFGVLLRLRLFAEYDNSDPYPITAFTSVTSWACVWDKDFSQATTPILFADSAEITAHTVTETINEEDYTFTEILIPVPDMNTEQLVAHLSTAESKSDLNMELIGMDGDGTEIFGLQIKGFTVRNRIYYGGEPTSIDPSYLTAEQVRALVAAGFIFQFSEDASSWHSTQVAADRYTRFRSASSDSSAWSVAIALPLGEPNAIDTITFNGSSVPVNSKNAVISATIGSATLTFTSGGSTVATFNANATSNVTVPLPSAGGGTMTVDSALNSSSTNPVQNKAIYSALAEKQIGSGTLTFTSGGSTVATFDPHSKQLIAKSDANATSDVTVPLPSAGSGGTMTVDSALNSSSTNPVQNKAIYSALAEKQIGSGTLTISSGGSVIATFGANQTSNTVVNLGSGGTGGSGSDIVGLKVSGGNTSDTYAEIRISGEASSCSLKWISPGGGLVGNWAPGAQGSSSLPGAGSADYAYTTSIDSAT